MNRTPATGFSFAVVVMSAAERVSQMCWGTIAFW
jgi:hypothetical protein